MPSSYESPHGQDVFYKLADFVSSHLNDRLGMPTFAGEVQLNPSHPPERASGKIVEALSAADI